MQQGKLNLVLVPVDPIGRRQELAFVDGPGGLSGCREITVPVYPSHSLSEQLAATRRDRMVTLHSAADRTGVRVTDFSGLEQGRMSMSDEDWNLLLSTVRAWVKGK